VKAIHTTMHLQPSDFVSCIFIFQFYEGFLGTVIHRRFDKGLKAPQSIVIIISHIVMNAMSSSCITTLILQHLGNDEPLNT